MPNYRLEKGSVQWDFAQSRAMFQVFGGAYGNGKTTAAVVTKALKLIVDYPGANGLIARATYPKLNDTIRKVFFEWCPKKWIRKMPTQDDNTAYMKNGTVVNFRYVAQRGKKSEDGSTSSNLLSATYDWIIIDQMEDPEITYKDFLDLSGRLRGQTPYHPQEEDLSMPGSGPRWFIMTANPSHNWLYKKLVYPLKVFKETGVRLPDLIVDPVTQDPTVELFEGDLYSNSANLPADFIARQESLYKGQNRDRYVLGKWAAFEGLVYPEFDQTSHVITRTQAMNHLYDCQKRHVKVQVIEGYDFGQTSPSCYILGFVDDLGRVILLDGFYISDFLYNQQPDEIRNIRSKYANVLEFNQPIWADPSIFKTRVLGGHNYIASETIAKLFSSLGILMRPGNNNIATGRTKVNSYLAGLPHVSHIITDAKPGPLLYIVDDLVWWSDEITSYYWRRNPLGQFIDEPQDGNDHAMDTTRYMLTKLPEASRIEPPQSEVERPWMRWQELEGRV